MNFNKEPLLDELETVVKAMEVPEFRRRNPGWLSKNLKVRNEEHPAFPKAQQLIRTLLQNGVAS